MSMFPWHGSTATTSSNHHRHPHHHQQQQHQHQHQHQHHPLHPHHPHHTANAATAAAAAASNSRIDPASTTTTATAGPTNISASTFQMPQMRWLPSMISARTNPQHAALPNLSTNSRLQQQSPPQPTAQNAQQHQHHHARPHTLSRHPQQQSSVSMVIDARQQSRQQPQQQAVSVSSEESDPDNSDSGARDATSADALGGQAYVSSDAMGANAIAHAHAHARAQQQQQRRHGHRPEAEGTNGTTAATSSTINNRNEPILNRTATPTRPATTTILVDDRDDLDLDPTATGSSADHPLNLTGDRDGPRKHGKRLTTLEEVSLFNICNRHGHEFGQRSNLCKWWMTVTEEFTRDQGHPYSWHSVRRKVELVTKQRMKFLDEQRERGGSESDDHSNLRWRAAVDAWIPTWQRWEEAEAKRIEKRDSRKPRKRKNRDWEAWVNGADAAGTGVGAWRTTGNLSVSGSPLVPAAAQLPASSQQPFHTPRVITPQNTKVRLPPGFDNMFASQSQSLHGTPTPAPALQQPNGTPGNTDSSMMSAVLETLGKLNRHLDAANSTPASFKITQPPDSRSRPTEEQQPPESQSDSSPDPDPSPTQSPDVSQVSSQLQIPIHLITKLKAELREEMREEMRSALAKDRGRLEEKLDSVQRTQDMILEMLRQEPS
ncbi:uncharacterized protein BO97DRAFT_103515 [Aspergillus homomorphus CBS 101889]|uniref:Sex determining protein n=1 Tax=Aspergillus homomorphus (strain CBS 101889) TaxID=1450537 RepID=A0A395HV41_ASPHC|nr:hypothetical protein BO97DRAFT_103515 [Aspergillus homomorphus CBS 101889]RAL11399.1 hypothetical protein BO97DRAFT_103515 [Aspergillus homomorphus CBS 101889]